MLHLFAGRRRRRRSRTQSTLALAIMVAVFGLNVTAPSARAQNSGDGKFIFRFDTYGDERQWTTRLQMHRVIESSLNPLTALQLGLRVDSDALPPSVIDALKAGKVDLKSPATTLALIKLNAIVGVVGTVQKVGNRERLTRVGITCALCHSTVDDSITTGIGKRLDGWPNTKLDPGKIIALSPTLPKKLKQVYNSWGPGKYDPRFNIDGQSTPLVIPPAFGLAKVALETYTGDGPISYWNQYVAVTQMGGSGTFIDQRLGIRIIRKPELVVSKLPALQEYQFGLPTPPPPAGSFDPDAAERGKAIFEGAAKCSTCHEPPLYTDVNRGILHDPADTGMDPAYANRTATKKYRTTPLRALWQHPPYFHDGSAPTLEAVVEHYDGFFKLDLTDAQKQDLVQFLKSI